MYLLYPTSDSQDDVSSVSPFAPFIENSCFPHNSPNSNVLFGDYRKVSS